LIVERSFPNSYGATMSVRRQPAGIPMHPWLSMNVMAPSETGYLFLLVIGFLSLAATVAVAVSAYHQRRGRKSEQPRAWR
jgi:hypothetical protein